MKTHLSTEVFSFLNELKANNNRDWFTEHKEQFKNLEKQVKQFYAALWEQLKAHDEVDEYKLFRIYRDVRFSADKTPYKTHFGGAFHRKKPALRGGYYLHIAPGECFAAVGFWEPNADDLQRIRKELERDASEFRMIINDRAFKNNWGELKGDELKSAPKGFAKEHADIELIRKKQYLFIKNYTESQLLTTGFLEQVNTHFKAVRPYLDYMSEILTTDLNGVSLIEK